MLKRLRSLFAAPRFPEDEDKSRRALYANVIALTFLAVTIGFELFVRVSRNYMNLGFLDLIVFTVAIICITTLVLLRRGHVQLASIFLVFVTWTATNVLASDGYGARDSSYILNFAIVLMAGLLLGWRGSIIVILLSVLSGFALGYAEQSGYIQVATYPAMSFAFDMAFVFFVFGVLIYLLINGLETALKKSRMNLAELESVNTSLNRTQTELQNRTEELVTANEALEQRTRKLHGIAMVTHTTASIQNFESMLVSITSTISKRLDYYHVGLFLLDEQRDIAILRSASTEAGRKMLERGYRVSVGQSASIGFVAKTAQPQVFRATSTSLRSSLQADLPDTQSELVLPLRAGHQVIGLLDIHSTETDAFPESEVSLLSILADQIAVTIQNSLLYEQAQNALQRAGINTIQASAEAWKEYRKALQAKGYRYDGIKSERLNEARPSGNGSNLLSVPVELRGQTIGSFKLNALDASRTWTEDELLMVKATADRVALALEGARLLDEAQKRAARETFLSDVATKLSASFQLDSILRDTVQELGQTLKNSTVTFQLVNPADGLATEPSSDPSEEQTV